MKYACLSDIHGNIEAFNACVKDAFQKGIDGFIFLGDYVTDFPFENEVLDKIQEIEANYPCYIIKGNVDVEEYNQAIPQLDECVFIINHIIDKESLLIRNLF